MSEHNERLIQATERLTRTIEHQTERLIMKIQDAIDALTSLTTAANGLSGKSDTLATDTSALITALGDADLTPDQQNAVTQAQASVAAVNAESEKVDAAVAAATAALPPAPPATGGQPS